MQAENRESAIQIFDLEDEDWESAIQIFDLGDEDWMVGFGFLVLHCTHFDAELNTKWM